MRNAPGPMRENLQALMGTASSPITLSTLLERRLYVLRVNLESNSRENIIYYLRCKRPVAGAVGVPIQ